MTIAWFRDLVISIWGLGSILAVLVVLVLIVVLFFKVLPIIRSVRKVTRSVENISTVIEEEVAGPLAQVVAFVQGFRKAMDMMGGFRKKKEGKHGRE